MNLISHKQFQAQIVHLAKLAGFEQIYHTWDSRHSPAGFPDLIIIKEGRQIVVELKVGKDNLSAEQYVWLLEFMKVKNTEVYVWWPEDKDEIDEVIYNMRSMLSLQGKSDRGEVNET